MNCQPLCDVPFLLCSMKPNLKYKEVNEVRMKKKLANSTNLHLLSKKCPRSLKHLGTKLIALSRTKHPR